MKVYIGNTSGNDLATKVCEFSIQSKNSSTKIEHLKIEELKKSNFYTRNENDPSNEFLKYFVPFISNYDGWVLYCNDQLLFRVDVKEIESFKNDRFAVMIVKQNNKNINDSLILWNCSHPSNKKLDLEKLNSISVDELKEFNWLKPEMIGFIDQHYNVPADSYVFNPDTIPRVLNFYSGGPWNDENKYCPCGAFWESEFNKYSQTLISPPPPGPFEYIPSEIQNIFLKILHYRADPAQEYYSDGDLQGIIKDLEMINNNNVYAVDGGWNPEEKKGLSYDPYMESFIIGSGGQITNYDKVEKSMVPVLFRGITKMKHMKACEASGRDYYYIDTGYFGNIRKKLYHRITKNAMQNIGPVIERPFDRLEATGWRRSKFRPGKNILLCPPSAKAMSCFGLELDQWMEDTINTIKKHTDRPIVIRKKLSRRERSTTDTMEMALSQDVHCLVTYNSIAATEALLNGKPAFALGPNAAYSLCHSDLSLIEKPHIPTVEELEAWAAHLAYCQFTELEMRDGTAWRILNDH